MFTQIPTEVPANTVQSKLQNLISESRLKLFSTVKTPALELPTQRAAALLSPTVKVLVTNPTAQSVLAGLQEPLGPTAAKLYTLLFDVALGASQSQGHPVLPSQQVIHQPVEIVAAALGLSKVTVYKHFKTLTHLGLIHARSHFGNWYGLTRSTGTLLAISLTRGHRARLRWDDLKHAHRDLQADTSSPEPRTAWAFLKTEQSLPKSQERCKAAVEALKVWSRKPGNTKNPVKDMTVNPENSDVRTVIYSLSELSSTHKTKQAALLDSFARALARGFLDSENLDFWRKLLWDALRKDFEGVGTLHKLSNALLRLLSDRDEDAPWEKFGAVLVARLKSSGVWDEIRCP